MRCASRSPEPAQGTQRPPNESARMPPASRPTRPARPIARPARVGRPSARRAGTRRSRSGPPTRGCLTRKWRPATGSARARTPGATGPRGRIQAGTRMRTGSAAGRSGSARGLRPWPRRHPLCPSQPSSSHGWLTRGRHPSRRRRIIASGTITKAPGKRVTDARPMSTPATARWSRSAAKKAPRTRTRKRPSA